jgi:hypothetical protein
VVFYLSYFADTVWNDLVKNPGQLLARRGLQPGFLLVKLTAGREGGPGFDFIPGGDFARLISHGVMKWWPSAQSLRIGEKNTPTLHYSNTPLFQFPRYSFTAKPIFSGLA